MKITQLKSGNYRAQVYLGIDKNGKKVFKSVTRRTKRECQLEALEVLKQGIKEKTPTVRKCIEAYIGQSTMLSPTTLSGYNKILKCAFQDIMDVPLADLNRDIVQEAVNKESQRITAKGTLITAKTVRNEYGLLKPALADAGYSFNVRLPKVYHKNEILPPVGEVISAIKGTDIELPCLLAMWLSLRLSEVVGLCYEDIVGDTLCVNRVKVMADGKEIIKPYAKTDASIRMLRVPNYILNLINDTRQGQTVQQNGLTPIFNCTGNAIHHKFIRAMQKASLSITFHDLRHYYASISLTTLGLPSKIVQVNGGWSSPQIMNRVYSQAFAREQEQSFGILNAFFESQLGAVK